MTYVLTDEAIIGTVYMLTSSRVGLAARRDLLHSVMQHNTSGLIHLSVDRFDDIPDIILLFANVLDTKHRYYLSNITVKFKLTLVIQSKTTLSMIGPLYYLVVKLQNEYNVNTPCTQSADCVSSRFTNYRKYFRESRSIAYD